MSYVPPEQDRTRFDPMVESGVLPVHVRDSMLRLGDGYRERKLAERVHTVPGFDNVWCFEDHPPAQAWTTAAGIPGATAASPLPGFGGYVQLPKGHPWNDVDLMHDGVPFAVVDEDGDDALEQAHSITWHHHATRWIGFDTGHAFQWWRWSTLVEAHEQGLVDAGTWERWQTHRDFAETMGALSQHDRFSREWFYADVVCDVEALAREVVAAGRG